jgi:hypothetical protein
MEAFYKSVLLGSHGSLAAILCLAMTIRIVMLIWSLPGVVVTMTGAYKPAAAVAMAGEPASAGRT